MATPYLEYSLVALDLHKYYYNSKGTYESDLACRTFDSGLSFLPIEGIESPIK